jgi:xanthine/uracil permease
MKRLMIFLFVFPAIATVTFYAVGYTLTGASQDSGVGPVVMYLGLIVPGLVVALIDWLVGKTFAPVVVATTLVTYALSVLALGWALGPSLQTPALGLIGAIPAAVCSWLNQRAGREAGVSA